MKLWQDALGRLMQTSNHSIHLINLWHMQEKEKANILHDVYPKKCNT